MNSVGIGICVAAIFMICYVARREFGSWVALPVFPITFWLAAVVAPLVFAPSYPVSVDALLYITASLTSWGAAALFANYVTRKSSNPQGVVERKAVYPSWAGDRLQAALFWMTLLGLSISLLSLNAQGYQLSDVASLEALEATARSNAGDRYQNNIYPPVEFSVGLGFTYAAAALGGVLMASGANLQGKQSSIRSGAPIAIALVLGLIENSKATPLYALVFAIGGVLAVKSGPLPATMTTRSQKYRQYGFGLLALSASVAALIAMQRMRFGVDATSNASTAISLKAWALGHLGGFSFWYEEVCCAPQLGWGANSANAIVGFELGVHNAPAQVPKPLSPGVFTNVDTVFSDLISDFGRAGSILLFAPLGAASVVLWQKAQQGSKLAKFAQILPYAAILWSFTTSLANYASCLLAGVLIVAVAATLQTNHVAQPARSIGSPG